MSNPVLCRMLCWLMNPPIVQTWDAFDFFTVSLTVSHLSKTFDKSTADITWGITLVLMFRCESHCLGLGRRKGPKLNKLTPAPFKPSDPSFSVSQPIATEGSGRSLRTTFSSSFSNWYVVFLLGRGSQTSKLSGQDGTRCTWRCLFYVGLARQDRHAPM